MFISKEKIKEDDGYILSTVLDGNNNKTYLLILDATNMKELKRIYAPIGFPMLCHGIFI
jgi:torulene dioxygenase